MTDVNLRSLALDVLLDVTEKGEFSHLVLGGVLDKYRYLSRQERAFLTRLCMGTLERMTELDYVIGCFSRVKVTKMKPVIRAVLRCGVYQLLYMDSVPDAAACNEAVRLAAKRGFGGLRGFVNGVLRSVARNADAIPWPDPQKEPVRALSVRFSMPEWITRRFLAQYGQERCVHILEAFLRERPLTVRVDTARSSVQDVIQSLKRQGITASPDPRLSCALHLTGYDVPDEIPEFASGLLYVQDLSSMMVAETAAPKPGDFVLDVCAAPGGKSIHIAQKLAGTGMVEARDLTERKAALIEENRERCGAANLRVKVRDALVYDREMEAAADIVIADLPCSGLGVIGTKPDIKYNLSEEKIRELSALQREILDVVCRYVKPGGKLVYSTCTMTPEENGGQAEDFLRRHPEFLCESQRQFLPDEGCDGFFIAGFRKKQDM